MEQPLVITDLSSGRNGVDAIASPDFPQNQCVDAVNVTWRTSTLGDRRNGCSSLLGGHSGTVPARALVGMVRENTDERLPVYWALNDVLTLYRFDPATATWSTPTAPTFTSGAEGEFNGVAFNNKTFFGMRIAAAVDRMAVYDPLLTKVRYVGMGTPAAPTAANTGAGAYAATVRYYRVRYLQKNGAAVIRQSEPSAVLTFTPSGAGTAARITKPATINEDETHWMIEASADNVSFFELTTVVVGTTTYDDSAAVSSYANGTLAKILGTCVVPPNAKYVVTDGNRIVFANWAEQGYESRVGWTPVLNSLNIGDDERIFQTATIRPYIDLNPKNGGGITGLQQIEGTLYVFKARQIWRGTPTEDLAKPYIWRRLTDQIGCIYSRSLVVGEDEANNPCLYFWSHRGPYRMGPRGLEYLGRDIEDLTLNQDGSPNVNMNATVIAHAVYYSDVAQWWVWWASGSLNHSPILYPDTLTVLHVKRANRRDTYGVRGGWSRYTGNIASAYTSIMGTRSGYNNRPWISYRNAGSPAAVALYACDDETIATDAGTAFLASMTTRSLAPMGKRMHIDPPLVIGRSTSVAAAAIDLSITTIRDRDATLNASGSVSLPYTTPNQIVSCEGVTAEQARTLQITIADKSGGTNNRWTLEALYIPLSFDGQVNG